MIGMRRAWLLWFFWMSYGAMRKPPSAKDKVRVYYAIISSRKETALIATRLGTVQSALKDTNP